MIFHSFFVCLPEGTSQKPRGLANPEPCSLGKSPVLLYWNHEKSRSNPIDMVDGFMLYHVRSNFFLATQNVIRCLAI